LKNDEKLKVSKVVIRKEVDRVKGDIAKQALEEENNPLIQLFKYKRRRLQKIPSFSKQRLVL